MRLAIDGQKKTSPVEHFDAKSSVTLGLRGTIGLNCTFLMDEV